MRGAATIWVGSLAPSDIPDIPDRYSNNRAFLNTIFKDCFSANLIILSLNIIEYRVVV